MREDLVKMKIFRFWLRKWFGVEDFYTDLASSDARDIASDAELSKRISTLEDQYNELLGQQSEAGK